MPPPFPTYQEIIDIWSEYQKWLYVIIKDYRLTFRRAIYN